MCRRQPALQPGAGVAPELARRFQASGPLSAHHRPELPPESRRVPHRAHPAASHPPRRPIQAAPKPPADRPRTAGFGVVEAGQAIRSTSSGSHKEPSFAAAPPPTTTATAVRGSGPVLHVEPIPRRARAARSRAGVMEGPEAAAASGERPPSQVQAHAARLQLPHQSGQGAVAPRQRVHWKYFEGLIAGGLGRLRRRPD